MGEFSDQGANVYPQYFTKGVTNKCQLASLYEITGYSLYSSRDYKRCVCNNWSDDLANCLVALVSPSSASILTTSIATATALFLATF